MTDLCPQHLEPLDDQQIILRLANPDKYLPSVGELDDLVHPAVDLKAEEFHLSSQDKAGNPPHLSVWEESLTTPEEALHIMSEMGSNKSKRMAFFLSVEEVRGIIGKIEDRAIGPMLDVIWTHLSKLGYNPEICALPGADGHCGIVGLTADGIDNLSKRQRKILRLDLRAQLADLASKRSYQLLA